ncbi:MAG: right-handed parallel beta-helix repeat-containing protein [Candidatus Heimdallarchaeaceae archaeon]
MKRNNKIKLAIFTLVILFTTSVSIINVNRAEQNHEEKLPQLNYTTSAPLVILNDTALAGYASSGDGSVGTPYIIEDLSITTTDPMAIYVESTTAYFTIKNCLLIAGEDALSLYSISSNTLEVSNNILSGADSGILVVSSDYVNITHNVCYGSSVGIELVDSDHLLLEINACYGNFQGMYTQTCNYLTLYDNVFYSNGQNGAYISTNSNFPNITFNRFYSNNQMGLLVDNSIMASITDNECYSNGYYGLEVHSGSLNTIKFNNVHDNYRHGMYIQSTGWVTVANNTITSNAWYGIFCRYSTNAIIENNTAIQDGFGIELSTQGEYGSLTVSGNTVNGKPLGYFNGAGEIILSGEVYGQLILAFCSGTRVQDYTIHDTSIALIMVGCDGVIVDNCDFNNNNYGSIKFDNMMNTTIQNSKCSNNAEYGGLYSWGAINTTIYNVTASNNQFGIYMQGATTFNISHNIVESNSWYNTRFQGSAGGNIRYNTIASSTDEGILLYNCDYTNITHNLFQNNNGYAIYADFNSAFNWIHHNAFIGNNLGGTQAYDDAGTNVWYDAWNSEGNYWDDYSGSGNYTIDGNTHMNDTYPLGSIPPGVPPVIPEFSNLTYLVLLVPVVLVSTLIFRRRKR